MKMCYLGYNKIFTTARRSCRAVRTMCELLQKTGCRRSLHRYVNANDEQKWMCHGVCVCMLWWVYVCHRGEGISGRFWEAGLRVTGWTGARLWRWQSLAHAGLISLLVCLSGAVHVGRRRRRRFRNWYFYPSLGYFTQTDDYLSTLLQL